MSNLVSLLWWLVKGIVYIAAIGFSIVFIQVQYPVFNSSHEILAFVVGVISPLLVLTMLRVLLPEFLAYLVVLGIVVLLYPKYSKMNNSFHRGAGSTMIR